MVRAIRLAACKPQDLTDCPVPPWLTSIPPVQADDVEGLCELCKRPVWVGPRNAALIAAGQATRACYQCAMAAEQASGGATFENVSPGRKCTGPCCVGQP